MLLLYQLANSEGYRHPSKTFPLEEREITLKLWGSQNLDLNIKHNSCLFGYTTEKKLLALHSKGQTYAQ